MMERFHCFFRDPNGRPYCEWEISPVAHVVLVTIFLGLMLASCNADPVPSPSPPAADSYSTEVSPPIGVNKDSSLTRHRFEAAQSFSEGLAAVRQQGRWGFIDNQGRWAISPRFQEVGPFKEGLAFARSEKGQLFGYIDPTGRWVIEAIYANPMSFSGGLAAVMVSGKFGFIDHQGKMVIPPSYKHVYASFKEGLAIITQGASGDEWAYVDAKGRVAIGPLASFASRGIGEGRVAMADAQGRFGFTDLKGHWLIPARFEAAEGFHEKLAPAREKGQWGFIDHRGQWAIPPRFDSADQFHQGWANVTKGMRDGFIDTHGRWLDSATLKASETLEHAVFISPGGFSDGLARIQIDQKTGYLDTAGRLVIPPQFEEAWDFVEGIALVKTQGQWHFIQKP